MAANTSPSPAIRTVAAGFAFLRRAFIWSALMLGGLVLIRLLGAEFFDTAAYTFDDLRGGDLWVAIGVGIAFGIERRRLPCG